VDTDLETLATALSVKTDDLLKNSPQLAPWRPTVGLTPQLRDAELVTLAMMQAILGIHVRGPVAPPRSCPSPAPVPKDSSTSNDTTAALPVA
jgi:hypothetical protein